MYTRSPHYLYQRNGIYYFTRLVPSDLKTKFNKNRVVISLRTSSKQKAIVSANKLYATCRRSVWPSSPPKQTTTKH